MTMFGQDMNRIARLHVLLEQINTAKDADPESFGASFGGVALLRGSIFVVEGILKDIGKGVALEEAILQFRKSRFASRRSKSRIFEDESQSTVEQDIVSASPTDIAARDETEEDPGDGMDVAARSDATDEADPTPFNSGIRDFVVTVMLSKRLADMLEEEQCSIVVNSSLTIMDIKKILFLQFLVPTTWQILRRQGRVLGAADEVECDIQEGTVLELDSSFLSG